MGAVVPFDGARPPKRVDPPPVAGRLPPHDLDAEAAVLSAAMLDRTALERVVDLLKPEHFYSDANARIFQACQTLVATDTPVDFVSVSSWLRDREWLQKLGGVSYLAQLVDATPSTGHVATHAKAVHEKWRLRQLIATCQRVSAEGYGDPGEVQVFCDRALVEVTAVASASLRAMPGAVTHDVADAVQAQLEEAMGGRVSGTSWGWAPVDDRAGLLMPQGYYVVPARSGHGKTQFATQTALNIAEAPPRDGYANIVYFASYEMPSVVLLKRSICTEADVPFKRVNAGRVYTERSFKYDGAECPSCGAAYRPETYETLAEYRGEKACADCGSPVVAGPSESERLASATWRLRQTQIIWDDRPCQPAELAGRVKAVQERAEAGTLLRKDGTPFPKGRVRAVIVDYLQRMPAPPGPNNRSRQREVADISNGLVEKVAKGCKVAVIALAQLNRAIDKQKEARPTLADIREAGDIEQDADEIVAIHREQYRLRDKTPLEYQNIAELIHLKGRGGLDADLPPARMWFVNGKFNGTPPDERMCGEHAQALRDAGEDRQRQWEAMCAARTCIRCYLDSWAAWAEKIGLKK